MIYNDLAHGGGTNQAGKTNAMATSTLANGAIEKNHGVGIIVFVCMTRVHLNMHFSCSRPMCLIRWAATCLPPLLPLLPHRQTTTSKQSREMSIFIIALMQEMHCTIAQVVAVACDQCLPHLQMSTTIPSWRHQALPKAAWVTPKAPSAAYRLHGTHLPITRHWMLALLLLHQYRHRLHFTTSAPFSLAPWPPFSGTKTTNRLLYQHPRKTWWSCLLSLLQRHHLHQTTLIDWKLYKKKVTKAQGKEQQIALTPHQEQRANAAYIITRKQTKKTPSYQNNVYTKNTQIPVLKINSMYSYAVM